MNEYSFSLTLSLGVDIEADSYEEAIEELTYRIRHLDFDSNELMDWEYDLDGTDDERI